MFSKHKLNLTRLIISIIVFIIITGGLLFLYKYRFYTVKPRILFFEQLGKSVSVKNNEWVNLLEDKFKKNNLKTKNFHNKCFEFWLVNEDKNILRIELHQYHLDGCPGDPNWSPRLETFAINKATKIISWYDVMQNKVVGFKEYVKSVK